MNLALYYTVMMTNANPRLPNISTLAAYQKLPQHLRHCAKDNWLTWIADNKPTIQGLVESLK